ncbi:MAG: hypothetical protein A2599_02450 [Candidatus Staskawiczbacteria bacterium RIFOXYD1_FULL_39_28]|uniref:Uncharacterized protein n=1 Tax=Candidatus Staskawiczbacteria bacterium RIFOXYC1_FULL_38_18 TaxID=1802229 RepID=A0A1G2JBU4_9BACT|nr:MAG: hypothetical protein A2401_01820 [Candidatus Staskawiczbacteria bacterium RIFOXYC1_FULL_38_18]OGZ90519.1 MAG: hypothetical protein A2599_02450 [Candidatus Staskawiczbacteria bacterium RIFOXYD1_FULL_39_28]
MKYVYIVLFVGTELRSPYRKELSFDAPVAKGDTLNFCEPWGFKQGKANDPDTPAEVSDHSLWEVMDVTHYFDKEAKNSHLYLQVRPFKG